MHLSLGFALRFIVVMASHLSYQEVDGCARTSPPLHTLGDLSHAGRLTDGGRDPARRYSSALSPCQTASEAKPIPTRIYEDGKRTPRHFLRLLSEDVGLGTGSPALHRNNQGNVLIWHPMEFT